MTNPSAVYRRLKSEIETVVIGYEEVIEGLTISGLANGHLLIEGAPGTAKTTIAEAFAQATGLEYSRIQMTPDLLPADITGTEVYQHEEFQLRLGPVFANLIVADEINRGTPKTQSALLEAMQEGQVTIGRETLALPEPFIVVATQNPIEMKGVYELPDAQRDRFQFRFRMDLLNDTDERRVVDRFDERPGLGPNDIEQVTTPAELQQAREAAAAVHVADPVKNFLIDIISATRTADGVAHGVSTRGTLMLLRGAKARAAIRDRSYVIPDDILSLVEPALAHRLVLDTDADLTGRTAEEVLSDIVADVDAPEAELRPDEPVED